ncbi:hypothetical protein ACSBR1_005261 [Camellia fascicularis]
MGGPHNTSYHPRRFCAVKDTDTGIGSHQQWQRCPSTSPLKVPCHCFEETIHKIWQATRKFKQKGHKSRFSVRGIKNPGLPPHRTCGLAPLLEQPT